MSTRSFGMVGKTYKSTQEAFKDAEYATAITRYRSTNLDGFGAFLGAIVFLGIFAYGFWITINGN